MITLEALTKDFGSTRAVNELSVDITAGKVTGFLGPNGAGKSTTMRMILGLDTPTAGKSLVNGVPYAKLRYPLHTVGAHISGTAGHPGHTPRTFLKALAQSNRIPVRRAEQALAEVGLQSVDTKRIGGFSLGMRQRLGDRRLAGGPADTHPGRTDERTGCRRHLVDQAANAHPRGCRRNHLRLQPSDERGPAGC